MWMQLHTRVSMCLCTRVHACVRWCAQRVRVHPDCHRFLPQRPPQPGTHVCVCHHCPTGSCRRQDRRTEGAGSPGQERNGSQGKQQTLPVQLAAACGCCCRWDGRTRGGSSRVFLCCPAGARDRTCVPVPGHPPPSPSPGPEHLGSDSAGRHEAQPGAAASQTSRQSLRRAAGLSGCQDAVVFGIMALPDDPAKQTGHRAEG